MDVLRKEIPSVVQALRTLHQQPASTKLGESAENVVSLQVEPGYYSHLILIIADKVQIILQLESQYGPLPGFTPALTDVIDYLTEVSVTPGIIYFI